MFSRSSLALRAAALVGFFLALQPAQATSVWTENNGSVIGCETNGGRTLRSSNNFKTGTYTNNGGAASQADLDECDSFYNNAKCCVGSFYENCGGGVFSEFFRPGPQWSGGGRRTIYDLWSVCYAGVNVVVLDTKSS